MERVKDIRGRGEEARTEEGGCLSHTFFSGPLFFRRLLESFLLLLLKEPASRRANRSSKYINEG